MDERTCSVESCGKPRKNGGMCWGHYSRNRRHGDPLGGGLGQGELRALIEAAAMSHEDACIYFPHRRPKDAYGTVGVDGVTIGAHRYVAMLRHGAPAPGAHALHSCHHRACINGSHIRWGTNMENMADKEADGTNPRGSRNPMAKLTESQVLDIVRSDRSIRENAELYGVTRTAVEDILAGRNWSWLTGITGR